MIAKLMYTEALKTHKKKSAAMDAVFEALLTIYTCNEIERSDFAEIAEVVCSEIEEEYKKKKKMKQ